MNLCMQESHVHGPNVISLFAINETHWPKAPLDDLSLFAINCGNALHQCAGIGLPSAHGFEGDVALEVEMMCVLLMCLLARI